MNNELDNTIQIVNKLVITTEQLCAVKSAKYMREILERAERARDLFDNDLFVNNTSIRGWDELCKLIDFVRPLSEIDF